jgi:hypothetical protein
MDFQSNEISRDTFPKGIMSKQVKGLKEMYNKAKSRLLYANIARPGSRVADLGCGKGADLLKYQRLEVAHALLVDVAAGNVAFLEDFAQQVGISYPFDAETKDVFDSDFKLPVRLDAVCTFGVLECAPNREGLNLLADKIVASLLPTQGVWLGTAFCPCAPEVTEYAKVDNFSRTHFDFRRNETTTRLLRIDLRRLCDNRGLQLVYISSVAKLLGVSLPQSSGLFSMMVFVFKCCSSAQQGRRGGLRPPSLQPYPPPLPEGLLNTPPPRYL